MLSPPLIFKTQIATQWAHFCHTTASTLRDGWTNQGELSFMRLQYFNLCNYMHTLPNQHYSIISGVLLLS